VRRVKVGLAGLVTVQAYRWLRVATSVQRHQLYWTRRQLRSGELRYVALGDSLAQGVGASHPERGYVGLLAARLEHLTGAGVEVINLSATGVLIDDVTRYQLPVLRSLDPAPDLVTVSVGTNDAGRRDHASLGARFDALCAQLPSGSLVADLPKFHRGRRAAAARDAAATIRDVLARYPRLNPVHLDEPTAHTGLTSRSADLFHPNDRGYRHYADQFWSALDPYLPSLLP
jgi:acyl-CoA thioesterase I